jgi:hypothetical protein
LSAAESRLWSCRPRRRRGRDSRGRREGGVDLGLVHEAFDVDHLGALELQLVEVVLLEDDVHVGLVLVALDDVTHLEDLIALLAALVVSHATVIIAMDLVEMNRLRGIDRVVDTTGMVTSEKRR